MNFLRKNLNLSTFFSFFEIIRLIIANKLKKFWLFIILLIITGSIELLTLTTLMPFLSILSNPESPPDSILFNTISNFFKIKSEQYVLFSTVIFISIVIFSLFIRLFTFKYGLMLSAELGIKLNTKIFTNIIYQPYKLQIQKNSSELISTLTLEAEQIITLIMISFRMIIGLFTFIFIFIGLIYINIYIASGFIILLALAYLFLINKSRMSLKRNSFILTDTNNKIIKHIQESLGSIRDIVIDNNHKYYVYNYQNLQKKLRYSLTEVNFISNSPTYIIESFALSLLAILGLFLILIYGNSTNATSILGTVSVGFIKLLKSAQQIYFVFTQIKSRNDSIKSVLSFLKQEVESSSFVIEREELDFKSSILLKNVDFRYGKNQPLILKNINLNLERGKVIGFIGKTGSGKSTLIDLIMGLLDPSKGEVLIDGKNIISDPNLRKKWFNSISHVPQDVYLCDGTFTENIALGVDKDKINRKKIIKAAELAQIRNFIDSSSNGFNTFVGERGIKLSGGQKQRIALARAIYKQSKILVLDEATSALDNKTEKEIINSINTLRENITIIMIAHRLSSLSVCNKIFELNKGEIVSIKDSIEEYYKN